MIVYMIGGSSEIGAHMLSEISDFIFLIHLFRSSVVANWNSFSKVRNLFRVTTNYIHYYEAKPFSKVAQEPKPPNIK